MTRSVDDELVILDVPSGRFFGLNDVGSVIWDRLERDATHDQLVDAVVAVFDVDRETASVDVASLVDQLTDAGLVTP
jgi:hypothetical protein